MKASIALEELELEYETHLVTLADADVKSPKFLSLNPNNKIPEIIDPNGPNGPVDLWESREILVYLAEKTGKLMGKTPTEKAHILQWLMFQMGGVGPMFGQMGFFVKFAGSQIDDPRPRDRYVAEAKRLLAVIDKQLDSQDGIVGDYSIADIAIAPWLGALAFCGAQDLVGYNDLKNVPVYVDRFTERPAVQRGRNSPARPT